MGFQLLDVDNFLKEKKAEEVNSYKTFDIKAGIFTPDPDGLYSPQIFGRNLKEKREKFGYINLKKIIFSPLIYKNLKKISTLFQHVANGKRKVEIVDGELIENINGQTGLDFLIQNWDKIDLDKYKRETNVSFIEFLKKINKKLIFINKYPVIPILYRPYKIENGRPDEDEITEMYKNILLDLHHTFGVSPESTGMDLDLGGLINTMTDQNSNNNKIQSDIEKIFDYFIDKLDKKTGFFNSAFIGKRIDNVTRLVANARPNVPVDCAVIPWHVLLNLFDVYVLKYIKEHQEIEKKLSVSNMTTDDFGKHIYYIYKNCDTYCKTYPEKQDLWIEVLEKVFNLYPYVRVLMKRDPAWAASSYWCLKPIIMKGCQYNVIVNSFYYNPLGGDSFNFNYMITKNDENKIEIEDYKINFKQLYNIQTLNKIYKNIN